MALTKKLERVNMYDDILPTKPNPRHKANIFSQLIFAWIIPLLYKGSIQGLKEDDLPKCLDDEESKVLGDKLERNWRQELLKNEMTGRKPSLRKALWKTIWSSALIDGSICLFYIMLKSLIPLILAQLLNILQVTQNPINSLNTTNSSKDNNLTLTNQESLRVEKDFNDNWLWFWHDVYMLGIILVGSTFVGCFINHHVDQRQKRMGAKMRIACCSLILRKATRLSLKTASNISVGQIVNLISNDVNRLDIGFVFAHYLWILPIQTVLIGYLIWLRLGYASIIGIVALLLQTIPLQMCLSTWTAKLRGRTAKLTDDRVGKMNEIIRGIPVIKMYAWEEPFQNEVKEARRKEIKEIRRAAYLRSFYLSSMILPERLTLFITIVAAVEMGTIISADAIFSIANLYHVFQLVAGIFCPMAITFASEAFVSIGRIEEFLEKPEKESLSRQLPHSDNAVEIDKVTASWDDKAILKNVSLKIPKGKLCIIAGPVGSGKSSLLQLILGELNFDEGSLKVEDDISFASQEPWLYSGSIKNNILFTIPYEHQHYQQVIENCSLLKDFEQLNYRDQTLVGERGAALSGGQKARINLARAVYRHASIYMFDDPLSAVDANVGRHLYEEVIGPRGLLQNKTRILVTHQTQYITEEADLIVWVEEGHVTSGNWQTMRDIIATQIVRQHPNIVHKAEKKALETLANEEDVEEPQEVDPLLNGKVPESNNVNAKEQVVAEDQGKGCVKANVWWAYFRAGNSICGLIFMTFILFLSQAVCSGADYFVNIYTKIVFMDENDDQHLISANLCLIIYSILIAAAIFMIIYRCYLFLKTCMHASKVLHDRMFGSILKATMRFFDTNPSGRILNRFSKDMGNIDDSLPRFMSEFTHLAFVMLGVLVVICIVNPVLLLAVFLVGLVDFYIIKLYLRSSQDLKRLEGTRRSPVFSHVPATLNGLTTIRSRKCENVMIEEFDNLQDIHSAAYHLTLTSNTALGLWLDCANVLILLNSVTFSFIYLNDGNTYSGNVGLAITQAMMLTGMVQYGLRQLGEAFQQMTSVERILEYTKLKQERKEQDGKEPENVWPNRGVIQYEKVNVKYHEGGQDVLKNLNFIIGSGWKVGIVGRTGAGKTSLISSLFRLCDYITGDIIIDGYNTNNINLKKLRSSLSIIPQEPVLFKGTLRYNLDPFKKHQDHEMWKALKDVQLGNHIPLDFEVTEFGSNLSIGERQLICLARALLGKSSILVMDEATANVDQNTDQQIQKTIQLNFAKYTVITVAHRLKTVMKSDRIMVLDNGELKEFGIPHELLQKPNGFLKQMVQATGDEASNLEQMAKEYYEENVEN